MTKRTCSVIASFFLVGLGMLFLLENFGVFHDVGGIFLAGMFGLLATLGFTFYLANRKQWWVLFPSAAFLGLSGAAFTDGLYFLRGFEGGFFFLGLSTAFWIIFVTMKKHWWAGIPAGVLTTMAFVATVDSVTSGSDIVGSIMFIGFGLTFGMLWLLRKSHQTAWAIYPAVPLLAIGLFAPIAEPFFEFGWPLVLIALGGWLVLRNLRGHRLAEANPSSSPGNFHTKNGHHNGHNGHSEPEAPKNESEFV